MDTLKKELLQAQKTRDDLMKWKLGVVSAVSAAALGFTGRSTGNHSSLALCVIPLACCYVDLLCRNLSIRTKLLSAFMSEESKNLVVTADELFEAFYQDFDRRRGRRDALEGLALVISTVTLSALVPLIGLVVHPSDLPLGWERLGQWHSLLFLGAGLLGLLGSALVHQQYSAQRRFITATADEWDKHRPGQGRPTSG